MLGLSLACQARESSTVSGCYYSHPVSLEEVHTLRLDLTQPGTLKEVILEIRPDVIIHTAGLTNVEECEAKPDLARKLHVEATRQVALAANNIGARMLHISTDHLFDGESAWRTEDDTPMPVNTYAKTKWLAEQAVLETCPDALIIRTNFFGWGTTVRASFSDWILLSLKRQQELTMFSDVFFTPILINHLVDAIIELINSEATGVFNVAGGQRLTKHAFALELARVFGFPTDRIRPISVDDFPFEARRPKDMSLSSQKLETCLKVQSPTAAEGLERLRCLGKTGWQHLLEKAISA